MSVFSRDLLLMRGRWFRGTYRTVRRWRWTSWREAGLLIVTVSRIKVQCFLHRLAPHYYLHSARIEGGLREGDMSNVSDPDMALIKIRAMIQLILANVASSYGAEDWEMAGHSYAGGGR